MSQLTKLFRRRIPEDSQEKAPSSMRFSSYPVSRSWLLARTTRDYKLEVDGGDKSSIVHAALNWITRNFPEAPLQVEKLNASEDVFESVRGHDLTRLVNKPNDYYSGTVLWMATLIDYTLDGNAYWIKVRARSGKPAQLWYAPAALITPIGNDTTFISHYLYTPSADQKIVLRPEDVVHFRYGLDRDDPKRGLSQMKSLYREIFTDEEASNFSASVLANMGTPGVVISPSANAGMAAEMMGGITDAEIDKIKLDFKSRFGGDKRGEPLIMMAPTDVNVVSWSPKEMDLKELRRLPEERVTAVLGLSAMVLGLGAGLERSTFANYAEAREAAYENNIIPTQRILAEQLTNQLLADYEVDLEANRVSFDLAEVRALQDDRTEAVKRANIMVAGGWAKVSEGRASVGMPIDDTHDIYLRANKISEVPGDYIPTLEEDEEEEEPTLPPEEGPSEEDLDEEDEQRSLLLYTLKQRYPKEDTDFLDTLDEQSRQVQARFSAELERRFSSLGRIAERAYRRAPKKKTQAEDDAELVDAIIRLMAIEQWVNQAMPPVYQRYYALVGEITFGTVETHLNVELGFNIADPVARKIIETGGKRIGLIDFTADTKSALFKALRDGRVLGEGADDLARRIRQYVPQGRFVRAGPNYRARMIARTETKYAQNISALEAYKKSDVVEKVRIVDAQIGPTDAECEERDGTLTTLADAEALASHEHPNGTLNFIPVTR